MPPRPQRERRRRLDAVCSTMRESRQSSCREVLCTTTVISDRLVGTGSFRPESEALPMARPLQLQIAERARSPIADERHWCRGELARDINGEEVSPIAAAP